MSAGPSIDEIIGAVEASGYLMEQHVATRFEEQGFSVDTNYPFSDPDEGKSREIDVRAFKNVCRNPDALLGAQFELLIECKNNSNPLVFISRQKNPRDYQIGPSEFLYPYTYEARRSVTQNSVTVRPIDQFFHLGFNNIHFTHNQSWKTVQFCRIDRDGGKWKANHANVYDALLMPMMKAIAIRQGEVKKNHFSPNSTEVDWRYFWFFFPRIICRGDLYNIKSENRGENPESVDFVSVHREIHHKSFEGHFCIHFVKESAIETFIRNCLGPIAMHLRYLVGHDADLVAKTNLAWPD